MERKPRVATDSLPIILLPWVHFLLLPLLAQDGLFWFHLICVCVCVCVCVCFNMHSAQPDEDQINIMQVQRKCSNLFIIKKMWV